MVKVKRTYRAVILAILVWEILMWLVLGLLLKYWKFFEPLSDKTQLVFKNPNALWLLWIVVPMLISYFIFLIRERNRYQKIGTFSVIKNSTISNSPITHFFKFLFLRNFVVFTILAMALPVSGTKNTRVRKENKELILAMDISSSMDVKDAGFTDSRLTIAKRAATQLINNLRGEKVGIVIFARNAYVQLPLTNDYTSAKMYIDEIETSLTSNQGTVLSTALIRAQQVFIDKKSVHAVILFSDVEDHQGGLDSIVKVYQDEETNLSILAIGTEKGGLIPNNANRPELGNKIDEKGKPIVSKLNLSLVKDLAKQTNGSLLISNNSYPNIELLLQEIKKMKRGITTFENIEVKENKYQIPLMIAFLSFLLFGIFKTKRNAK
jgi:Ca-activated chloride channel family protein